MMNFCTLFDSNYAAKGIAMYLSLERHTDDFVLYVMALDRKCAGILSSCGFRHMVVECIDDIMSPELSEAKANRSQAEFCWTCGSYVTDWFIHRYNLPDITYLDSDLMFFSSPEVIFDELATAGASVGISPHFGRPSVFGNYCVQFVYFKNDENGCACLDWWKSRCLEWCYSKLDGDRFGDQKYLDRFGKLFHGVHPIANRGAGLAYWNLAEYDRRIPEIFFHYSGVNVSFEKGAMNVRLKFYIPLWARRKYLEPYFELLAGVYRDYFGMPVGKVSVKPLNPLLYPVKAVAWRLGKFRITGKIINFMYCIRYRTRFSPYSER